MDFNFFIVASIMIIHASALAIITGTFLFLIQQNEDKIRMRDKQIRKLNKKKNAFRTTVNQYKKVYGCHVYGCKLMGTTLVNHTGSDKIHLYCLHHKISDAKPFVVMGESDSASDSNESAHFSKMTTISSKPSDFE